MSTDALILGILLIASLMVAARLFRKKLGNFDQHFQTFKHDVETTEKQVRDGNLSISLGEQRAVMRAAIAEELDVLGLTANFALEEGPQGLRLQTPSGPYDIVFMCRQARLRSQNRVLHGGGEWALRSPDHIEVRSPSLGETMHNVRKILQGESLHEDEGAEFRRRFPA